MLRQTDGWTDGRRRREAAEDEWDSMRKREAVYEDRERVSFSAVIAGLRVGRKLETPTPVLSVVREIHFTPRSCLPERPHWRDYGDPRRWSGGRGGGGRN